MFYIYFVCIHGTQYVLCRDSSHIQMLNYISVYRINGSMHREVCYFLPWNTKREVCPRGSFH